jgi:hypothetical protein
MALLCAHNGNAQRLCLHDKCVACLSKSVAGASALLLERGIAYAESNNVPARQTFVSSGQKRTFTCLKLECAHSWDGYVYHLSNKKQGGCPFCSNHKLCENADCVSCLSKSIAGALAMLSKRNISYAESNTVSARQTFLQCNKTRTFTCTTTGCAHNWNTKCNNVCSVNQQGCPFCSNQKLCENADCISCLSKSVAGASALLVERDIVYAATNEQTARQTFLQCNKKRTWTCTKPECAHSWDATCASVCGGQQSGCPFCSNSKLCENADCVLCQSKSVAGASALLSVRSIVYAATNTVWARQTFVSSGFKRTFSCARLECAHSWDAVCYSVCGEMQQGCPFCSNPPNQLCKNANCVSCLSKSVAGATALLVERGCVCDDKHGFGTADIFTMQQQAHLDMHKARMRAQLGC